MGSVPRRSRSLAATTFFCILGRFLFGEVFFAREVLRGRSNGVMVAFVQMPWRSGWPSGVRGAVHFFGDAAPIGRQRAPQTIRPRRRMPGPLSEWRIDASFQYLEYIVANHSYSITRGSAEQEACGPGEGRVAPHRRHDRDGEYFTVMPAAWFVT